ncbi:MAG: 3-dehydroquinate synthase [Pseudomonadota bacterium]
MIELQVDLADRSYPIVIGAGLLKDPPTMRQAVGDKRALVITNQTVADLYLAQVQTALDSTIVGECVIGDGEEFKNIETFEKVIGTMLGHRLDRGSLVIALGGGVVGDLGGFAAACYQRGIDFVQLPTTLLAQVDSSVGGKTAVNHALGKNMIGAFHQPIAVIIDTDTLKTLPDRELQAGIAEVIKYGLIGDHEFFAWLEVNIEKLMARDPQALEFAIERSCRNKAMVVSKDEREGGLRAILNLGHTFGHAIEKCLGYGQWLHGEAVGAGMVSAARMSAILGYLTEDDVTRTLDLVRRAGLPSGLPDSVSDEQMLEAMRVDKKNAQGRITLVLLDAIGTARITRDYPDHALLEALSRSRER